MSEPVNKNSINFKAIHLYNSKPERIFPHKRKSAIAKSRNFKVPQTYNLPLYCKLTNPFTRHNNSTQSYNPPLIEYPFPSSDQKTSKAMLPNSRSKGFKKSDKVTFSKTIITVQQTTSSTILPVNK